MSLASTPICVLPYHTVPFFLHSPSVSLVSSPPFTSPPLHVSFASSHTFIVLLISSYSLVYSPLSSFFLPFFTLNFLVINSAPSFFLLSSFMFNLQVTLLRRAFLLSSLPPFFSPLLTSSSRLLTPLLLSLTVPSPHVNLSHPIFPLSSMLLSIHVTPSFLFSPLLSSLFSPCFFL